MKLIYNLIFLVLLCFLSACAVTQKERLTASTSEITNALQNLTEIELNINQRHLLQHKQHTKMQDNLSTSQIKPSARVFSNEEAAHSNLWMKISHNLVFDAVPMPRLKKRINWYLTQPNYLLTVNKRAAPYLYHIVNRIEQKKLPMELVLLPFIESDFRPVAVSNRDAVGVWQLVDATAYHFGVKRNKWYDGRKDVLAATDAALNYLVYLYNRFNGDWLHAIAAYNSGEARVKNAIALNKRLGKSTRFWSLKLPKETADYVPKLLALSYLLQNQHPKFNLPTLANKATTSLLNVEQQFDFSVISQLTGVPKSQLHKLNQGYLKHQSAPQGPHKILLPLTKQQLYTSRFFNRHFSQIYTVKHGDTLYAIAGRFNTRITTIKALNKKTSNLIKVGEKLIINQAIEDDGLLLDYTISPYLAKQAQPKTNMIKIEYEVKNGDTLWHISKRFNVSVKDLLVWNNLKMSSVLTMKSQLTLHLPAPKKESKEHSKEDYLLELESMIKSKTTPSNNEPF